MVSATEKGGGKLDVLQDRFRAGLSPAMVCVGIPVLGTKHGQYTLGTLYSPLAIPQSYGSAKRIGLTDGVGRILFRYIARPSGGDSDLRNWVSITKPLIYHSFHFYPPKEAPVPFENATIGFSSSPRF